MKGILIEKLQTLNVRFIKGEVVEIKANLKRVQVAGKDFNYNMQARNEFL